MYKNRFYIISFSAWFITGALSLFFFLNRNHFGNYTHQSSYNDFYPAGEIDHQSLTKWQKSFQQYSDDEKKTGKELSAREAGIEENEPVLSKTEKLGSWLIKSFWNYPAGQPSDSVDKLRPIELYKASKALQGPVWCGTYGAIFLFFCACHHITCRYIESIGGPDHHVINECYIPELKQWIIVDLTHKILNATDEKGKYLNAGDIINMYKEDHTEKINVFYLKDSLSTSTAMADNIKTEWGQYLTIKNSLLYYYLIDLKTIYSTVQKIKRYLFPESWYEIYSENKNSNSLFFIRSSLLIAWIFISIFIPLKFFIFKRIH